MTRYDHTGIRGGHQDQGERKDEGWRSRQGADQSQPTGDRGPTEPTGPSRGRAPSPALGTNTQGDLPGIAEAKDRSRERLVDEGFDVDAGEIPDAGEDRGHGRAG